MPDNHFSFPFGDYRCTVIRDHAKPFSLSKLISNIPAAELAEPARRHGFPPKIVIDYQCLIIDTGPERLLVDAGWGDWLATTGRLRERLPDAGYTPEDITVVFMTHADRDHSGGLLTTDGAPAFPNARVAVPEASFRFWTATDSQPEAPDYMIKHVKYIFEKIGDRLLIVPDKDELLPGLQILPAAGHRPDHVTLKFTAAGQVLHHLADTVIHPFQLLRRGWHSYFDSYPYEAVQIRQRILDDIAVSGALMFASHMPFPGLGRLEMTAEGWRWISD